MVHQFKLNGYNIVLDTNSTSVHVVDEVAYDIIALYQEMDRDGIIKEIMARYGHLEDVTEAEIIECIEDVETLIKKETLFSEDIYAQYISNFKMKGDVIKALCLHVAHTCNLNCSYCFAAQGKFHGERAIMSYDVGVQALNFLIAHSGTRKNLEVDFFGGEPLMNFSVVKRLVAYARSQEKIHNKVFRFTLTTNGMLIDDDVIDFANREMNNVVLSLDGRKEVNDHFRVDYRGKGSYDTIVPNFKHFVERRGEKEYYMRGTFTHNNVDFCNDILHMADLGFTQLSMEPVVCPPNDPYALTQEDLPKLFEQYELLALEMLKREKEGKPFTFYHYMLDLSSGPCIYKRILGCGAGTEYMAVTPWGELFPCHQFVSHQEYSIGDIWQGIKHEEIRDKFRKCNVYSRQECRECWAKLFCSGGCSANSYNATGDIQGVYEYGCELFKKRMECAIMMNIAQSEMKQAQEDAQKEEQVAQ